MNVIVIQKCKAMIRIYKLSDHNCRGHIERDKK